MVVQEIKPPATTNLPYEPKSPPPLVIESGEIEETPSASPSKSEGPSQMSPVPSAKSAPLVNQIELKKDSASIINTQIAKAFPEGQKTPYQNQRQQFNQRRGAPQFKTFNEPIRRWYPLRIKLDPPKRSRLDAVEQKEFLQFHAKFKDRAKLTNDEVRFYKKYLVIILDL